eukprot:227050_1
MSLSSKDINKLKRIDVRTKNIVFGCIREISLEIFRNNIFDNAFLPIQFITLLYYSESLQTLIDGCCNSETQYRCIEEIRQLLLPTDSDPTNANATDIINSGAVSRIIQLCQHTKSDKIKEKCLWIFVNLSFDDEHCVYIVNKGAHKVCIDMLKHESYEMKELALSTLGNIAATNHKLKDILLYHNILLQIYAICSCSSNGQYEYIKMIDTASWTMIGLCRWCPPNEVFFRVVD